VEKEAEAGIGGLTQNYLFSEVGQYIGTMPAMQSSIPISDSKFGK